MTKPDHPNTKRPSKSAVAIKGKLREIDLEHRSCQIYPLGGRYVDCKFEDRHEHFIKIFFDTYVIARGEATIRETDGRIKEMRIIDMEADETASAHALPDISQKPMTAKTLLKSGIVGMWKNRTDIGDSCEFASSLRKKAQTREAS